MGTPTSSLRPDPQDYDQAVGHDTWESSRLRDDGVVLSVVVTGRVGSWRRTSRCPVRIQPHRPCRWVH